MLKKFIQPASLGETAWRMLLSVAGFRLLILAVLSVFAYLPLGEPLLATAGFPDRLQDAVLLAGLIGLVHLAFTVRRWPSNPYRLSLIQILLDTLLITLLVHYTGGSQSPLLVLYLLVIVSAAFLLGRHSAFYLAVSTLVLIFLLAGLRVLLNVEQHINSAALLMFGLGLFAIATLSDNLALRLRRSEALLEERGSEIHSLSAMNNEIIQHMDLGVIVVNQDNRVLLTNPLARTLTGYPEWSEIPLPLDIISPALLKYVIAGRQGQDLPSEPVALKVRRQQEHSVRLRCVALDDSNQGTVLILLSDVSQDQAREQQTQLAALGRLTANIAHEIRNPLSAISHAAQLLAERQHEPKMQRLTRIIVSETDRLNQTLESVLELGSPRPAEIQDLPARTWFENAMEKLKQDPTNSAAEISYFMAAEDMIIRADPAQLQQVLWNMVRNSTRYGHHEGQYSRIEIHVERESADTARILVRDHGPGVPASLARRIFEPFFTTNSRGTGLGLNIVRELVLQNHGNIEYYTHPRGGAVFKITLPLAHAHFTAGADSSFAPRVQGGH